MGKRTRKFMKKALWIFVPLVVIGAIVMLPLQRVDRGQNDARDATSPGRYEALNETTCSEVGGTWNACGSVCRTTPEEPCIEVCATYCECTGDAQCPTGFTCGDYVDNVGVCL